MDESANVLVVDDDPEIRKLVSEYLTNEGFVVQTANDADETWRRLGRFKPDVILLDVRLPDDDGMSMIPRLRGKTDCGIVMLTAKTEVVDRVMGLESGADDYIPKPFHLRELLARVRSVLRRRARQQDRAKLGSVVSFHGWTLNLRARELSSPDRRAVELTSKEFDLLKLLVAHAGETVTRNDIARHFGSKAWNPLARNVDVLIFQLRSKIESDPHNPALIKTVRGAGYTFTGTIDDQ